MENITKTIDRIMQFVEYKQISLNKFSTEIGVSNSYFHKMSKNKASIGSDFIEKIVRIYPELSAEWLITGKGKMITENNINVVEEPNILYNVSDKNIEMIDKLIDRIQGQSEEIGKLKKEIEDLKRGSLSDADGVEVAAAS